MRETEVAGALSQDSLPDDYLLFVLSPAAGRWQGACEAFEGFHITFDVPTSWPGGALDAERIISHLRQSPARGTLTYPDGRTTEISYEIVDHRGRDDVFMKTTLGYFLWERLDVAPEKIAFAVYWWYRPPARDVDVRIISEAERLLATPDRWHQEDDRRCEEDVAEGSFSLYCSLKHASLLHVPDYNHHNAPMQTVRFVIGELAPGEDFSHALMNYNNAPSTTHGDILRCLRLAKARLEEELQLRNE